jgi:hypothetical protein
MDLETPRVVEIRLEIELLTCKLVIEHVRPKLVTPLPDPRLVLPAAWWRTSPQ